MELRFTRWALLLLFLTIVATEGVRGPSSKVDDEKLPAARARGSSRFSSRNSASTEATPPETSSMSSDVTITKASRRVLPARRNSPNRSGVQSSTTVKIDVEQTSANSRNLPANERNSEQSRPNPIKINHQGLPRFASRKLAPKVQNSEPEKIVENSKDTNEKKFLSESVRENARTARARNLGETSEAPKVSSTERTENRRSSRLHNGRSKANLDDSGPSVFTGSTDNSRSRTGRKVQNSPLKQSNSPRYARNQRIDDSNPNTSVSSNRRSSVHDISDFRKKLAESRLKQDITASGSESVRFNIPLNFEEPRKLSRGGSVANDPTTEKGRVNPRYKSRGRQSLNDRRQESDLTTSTPVARGTSRRTGSSRGYESTTESRGRNRAQEHRKNIGTESSSTTTHPEFRRRNFSTKATARSFDTSRGFDNNRVSETRSENIDRKSNRSRGRYRVEVITTDAPSYASSTFASRGPSVVSIGSIGNITPTYAPEVVTTTPPPTTSRAPASSTISARPVINESRRNNEDNESAQPSDQRRRLSKEDYFNHGLGFRGRRPPIAGVEQVPVTSPPVTTTVIPSTVAPSRAENLPRGNPGWTLRRRPGHVYDGPSSGPNSAASLIPGQRDNRVTTTASSLPKTGRRGNKTNVKTVNGGKKDDINENDNYPPDFKARLAQAQKISGQSRTQEDNKTTSDEQFAARSKAKLENARKLIKPELMIDETSSRQVIVEASPGFKDDTDQKPSDSEVDEDQKVFKVTRKSSPTTEKSESGQKSTTKSDWKPSKLRKNFKDTQTRISRYKQLYAPRTKVSLLAGTTTTSTDKNLIEENVIDTTTQSNRAARYKENKFKFAPKLRGSKLRGPKASHDNSIHEDIVNSTTKSPLAEKSRKAFSPRKNDKSYVDDIKAVALKLRKTLESMEKSQTPRPARRSDPLEGSTTLLTTMRTVKSFSFSTRLVKMDDSEAATASTTKMLDDEVLATTESTTTTFAPTSSTLPVTTEFTTQNPSDNEVTTSSYENVLASSDRPSSDDIANEIDNSGVFSTTELTFKSTESSTTEWKAPSTDSPVMDYKPRVAALSNDSGTPVYLVYPSATEKPLSIAITPKVLRYQATIKPDDDAAMQQSVTQEPVISVKVSSGNESAEISIRDSSHGNSGNIAGSNIFNPIASAAILETGNSTLLEQLRSTVAPLLNTLGNKSPVFSGVYKNTNSANSLPRVTPSGAPPRFSARYRGAELFVRRPTPPTTLNSLTENNDALRPIDVSSPGEPKVLTFYQAVETASVNNEQTDVRQLWQLAKAAKVENNAGIDPYNTNGPNSDSPPIIRITNTFNDISPVYINNASTPVPDTTNTSETTITHKTTQSNYDPSEATSENELKETTTVSTTSDPITIIHRLEDSVSTTESTMSTSTELMTEVSVSTSDSSNQNKLDVTTSPSSPSDSAVLDTNKSESSSTQPSTTILTSSIMENSTEVPTTSSTTGYSTSSVVSTTEAINSRTPKQLDDSNSAQVEVSNSLLDITLSASNNETTQATVMEIRIGQGNAKTTELESLAQVKETTTTFKIENLNSAIESTTEILQPETVLDSTTTEKIFSQTTDELTSPSELMTSTSTVIQITPEVRSNSSPDTNENVSTTELPITISDSTIVDKNQEVTTTLQPETINLENDKVTDSNDTSKTMDVEIEFYDAENATIPAGTENPLVKDLLNNKDKLLVLQKLVYLAINLTENNSSDNNLNQNIMDELSMMAKRFSQNSTDMNEFSFDQKNMDSSTEELPQLVESLVDNQNQSVTNESTVEPNNETTVVTQTTNISTTTIVAEFDTNSTNANTITDTHTSSPNTQSSESIDTTTFSPLTTTTLSADNAIINSTDMKIRAQYLARMLQIFSKLMNAKPIADLPAESDIQELNLLTPSSTDTPAVVEDITKTALENDSNLSSSLAPTTTSYEAQTSLDLTTIAPTMLTPLQGSTPSTAQRTAGITNRPDQIFTTSEPTTTLPSSFAFSSTTTENNDIFFTDPQKIVPTTTTTPTVPPKLLSSSSFASSTTSTPADYPINRQQSTMPVPFAERYGPKEPTNMPPNSGSSSSTTAPVRDYHIYGILPNKTIVRKRPEDNLIGARNVDSPYVIFGIFPDGKLVRKFPNGTVIPDPPSNPVEVVFSLSTTTTTTNRPSFVPDNQFINHGTRNKNFDYFNNRSPVADVNTQNAFYEPNEVDNALSIGGPTGFNLPLISVGSGTKKMTATVANDVTLDNNGQGGRIFQDKVKDEASKTSESNGERNSVFVGQEKFVNYWTNGQPASNPTVVTVNLTSVATAARESSLSAPPQAINLDILPNSQSANQVTAPPGFPWKDPLDQIFGIPSDSPALKASQASNAISEGKKPTTPIAGRPVNNLVEIFSPLSSTINSLINTPTKPPTTTTTTNVPTTQTSTTSTSTTQVPVTPISSLSSTVASLITMNPNLFGTKFEDLAFLNALLEKPNPGEATPKTLSEVEQLLANKILSLALGKGLSNGGPTRSPKAIQPSNASPNSLSGDKVSRFTSSSPVFAGSSSRPIVIDLQSSTTRKIPTTSATWKPVRTIEDSSTASTNTIVTSTIIPTTTSSTTTSTTSTSATPRTTTTSTTPRTTTTSTTLRTTTTSTSTTPRTTSTSTTTTTTRQPTTKSPVIITAKSVTPRRPRPTTQAPPTGPFALAASLLQTIFGRNPFALPTTPRPSVRRPVVTARKIPPTTKVPTTTTTSTRAPHIVLAQSSHTPRSIQVGNSAVDISSGQSVVVTNTIANTEKPVEISSPKAAKQSTSTFSPQEDAKFLTALLELARQNNDNAARSSTSAPKANLDADDEAFLRAILSEQAKIQPLSTAGGNDQNDAALLAAFLKEQGIEPSTPANSLRQQLQQSSKTTSTTTRRPTITTTTTRRTIARRPSIVSFPSAYPPPLFSNFGALSGGGGAGAPNINGVEDSVRSQVVNAAIGMTRAFGQFLGAAITGAAQQFQTFVKNGSRLG